MTVLQRWIKEARQISRRIPINLRSTTTIVLLVQGVMLAMSPMWTPTRTQPTSLRFTRNNTATLQRRPAWTDRDMATSVWDQSTLEAARHRWTDPTRAVRESPGPQTSSRGRTPRSRWPRHLAIMWHRWFFIPALEVWRLCVSMLDVFSLFWLWDAESLFHVDMATTA